MPERTIKQDDILSLIHCAESYGHWNEVCMDALVNWAAPIADEDIQRYASWFISDEGVAQSYTEEDHKDAIDVLTRARSKYQK